MDMDQWRGSKGGKPRKIYACSDSKDTKKKHESLVIQERVTWPGRYGYRWARFSCMKELRKVCGEPWDGLVTKNPLQW